MDQSMNRLFPHVRRALVVAALTVLFVLTPVLTLFSSSSALAFPFGDNSADQPADVSGQNIDRRVIKGIQDKAEDLGDDAERDIGVTGLKNIRELPENLPETAKMVIKQRTGNDPTVQPRSNPMEMQHK